MLRWVLIKDCAILIGKHKCGQIFFDQRPDIFNSEACKEYTHLCIVLVERTAAKFDVNIAQLIPGLLGRLMAQSNVTKDTTNATRDLHDEVRTNQQDNSASAIGTQVKHAVDSSFFKFVSRIGKLLISYSQA